MNDFPRLIEYAFPLKQASLDSVHEKNVRHGHISTLHIWPARRPLAACRAALIATLLPDPSAEPKPAGMSDAQWDAEIKRRRKELCEKIGGRVVKKVEKKKMPNGQTVERIKEETEGGILHWRRETENAETLNWFREEIKKAYGGRAPKVLDPFAGGGAIPLEAMRLGCEATAIDINPVAWFILKCTLEYPQKLTGQSHPLPEFILHNDSFMAEYFTKSKGYSKAETKAALKRLHERLNKRPRLNQKIDQGSLQFQHDDDGDKNELHADLAWHVRAWGQWVLERARRELAQYYPTYSDFEPIKKDHIAYEHQPTRLVPFRDDGAADISLLNAEFTSEYLEDKRNPRWVAKPVVAYLWARTVRCKNCRAIVPLLKTRWLCKKANKRVLLTMESNSDRSGIVFGIDSDVPAKGGNAAQKREHDKRAGLGTMSRAGAKCPCCGVINTGEDIRVIGQSGQLGVSLSAVVVDSPSGKDFRVPTTIELELAQTAERLRERVFANLPGGELTEPIPKGASRVGGGSPFTAYIYGISTWGDLYTDRQLAALGSFAAAVRESNVGMDQYDYPPEWQRAVAIALALSVDKQADRSSANCRWDMGYTKISSTFTRFALPILWDFCEANVLSKTTGNYLSCVEWVAEVLEHCLEAGGASPKATVLRRSAIAELFNNVFDVIVTDPPYYDAIPYSDLMDFFYVWLRRSLRGRFSELDENLKDLLSPKWDADAADGELIDDASRHSGSHSASRQAYETGMEKAFRSCFGALRPEGRLVVVFAHKDSTAWETLVGAIIRAGFVVDGSWPIQTEMANRTRAHGSAALASSVWLVCKKRPTTAKPGWDNNVLEEMRANIAIKLREFWDAGIRGPDFVWAATGPAMEAYSRHPVVRKANEANATMGVGEFLNHVRRMVVDYVVGQVLTGQQGADMAAADRLDEVSAYYLLHRHDFGLEEAPVGACILYATACGLTDSELDKTWDILSRTGSDAAVSAEDEEDETDDSDGEAEPEEETGGGSKVKLKTWSQRRGKNLGYEAPEGKAVPLIDRIHRVMHLWKDGDLQKVDEYLDEHALRRNELFKRVVQSLIELSSNSERSLLESISNHIGGKGAVPDRTQPLPFGEE